MMMLSFYVPEDKVEGVKEALFSVGAGKIGHYDCCSFEYLGTGQFRPLSGSHPYLGRENQIERVRELKVEMVFEDDLLDKVVSTLKMAHPYETPAFFVTKSEISFSPS
jgi:structural hemagglutinin/hemolysin toxin protein RtxA